MKTYLVTILALIYLLTFVKASEYNYCGPRNILFLLDQSSSVNRLCLSLYSREECERRCAILEQDVDYCTFDNFAIAKDFIKSVIQRLDVGEDRTNIGIIRFSSTDRINYDIQLGSWPSEDKELLMIAIDELPYEQGLTHTRRALEVAGEYILEANKTYGEYGSPDWLITAHNMLVVITDGASNDGKSVTGVDDPVPIAQYYRRQGIKIVTLGIGEGIDKNELERIAGNNTNSYYVDNFKQLPTLENFMDDYVTCPIEEELQIIAEPEKTTENSTIEVATNHTENIMDNQTTPSKTDSTGMIVGVTVGSICGILLILGGTFAWFKYKNRNQIKNEKLSEQIHGNVLNNPLHNGEGQFIENELYGTDI